jgi:hypothetical protein
MKYILSILLLFNGIYSFGQVGFSNQTITINGNQVEIIQSTLFMDVQPHNCPKLDTFDLKYNQDTIHVDYYYDAKTPSIGMRCIQTDTIYINNIPVGNYTLIFSINKLIGDLTTSDTLFNQALDTAQILITSNHNLNLSSSITLYPNPTQQYLDIEIKELEVQEMYLFNIQGQLIKNIPKAERRLDLRNFDSGLYFLKIKTKKGWVNKKVMKQ